MTSRASNHTRRTFCDIFSCDYILFVQIFDRLEDDKEGGWMKNKNWRVWRRVTSRVKSINKFFFLLVSLFLIKDLENEAEPQLRSKFHKSKCSIDHISRCLTITPRRTIHFRLRVWSRLENILETLLQVLASYRSVLAFVCALNCQNFRVNFFLLCSQQFP